MWKLVILSYLTCLYQPSLVITEEANTAMMEFVWDVSETEFPTKQAEAEINSLPMKIYNNSVEHIWKVRFYPWGREEAQKDFFSLYLCYHGNSDVEMEYELYLANHKYNEHSKGYSKDVFNYKCKGHEEFIERDTVLNRTNGYMFGNNVKIGVRMVQGDSGMSVRNNLEYSDRLTKSLYRQWLNKSFTDLTLSTAQAEWSAHKVVLASHSSVFDEMLRENSGEEFIISIKINDEDCPDVESMLHFMYTGSVNITEDFTDLLSCAHFFNITGLKSQYESRMKYDITCDNSLERLIISHRYGLTRLKAVILNYILNNKCSIMNGENREKIGEYPDLLVDIVSCVLQRDCI